MKIKGFTLLELLITSILLIGLSFATVSSYSYLLRKNEQQRIVDELKAALNYAKIQTLILGIPVTLMPLDDSLNWANGLRLITPGKKQKLLYQWQWHHPRWSLNWKGARSANSVVFSQSPANAISNGHFTLTSKDTQQQTILVLNRLGRIRVSNNLSLIH